MIALSGVRKHGPAMMDGRRSRSRSVAAPRPTSRCSRPASRRGFARHAVARGRGVSSRLLGAAEELARPRARIACAVGLDNPRARRLDERRGYRGTGQLETCSFENVDDEGVRRTATETSEMLVKELGNA